MKKPRFTEEFLWQLHEFLEAINIAQGTFAPRSWKEAFAPEWRELRLAYEKKRHQRSFGQFISYLKRMGYIVVPKGESIGVLRLTAKGKEKAFEGEKKLRVLSPRKDGKMIMLMYDIPKRKQRIRQAFRSALEFLDYQMLQKSVWVSAKDVLEETEQAVREYGLDDCVNLFVIEKIKVQK
ncbi:MAG: CRISPR-associated endonuclease Cas2 [bacterium]|nr:CRISPR-associated endonuclease Cas2 [bacterium]